MTGRASTYTITVNGTPREVAEPLTVAGLLEHLDVRAQHVAVEVNREVVPLGRFQSHLLKPNDAVEIVTLVGGG